MDARGIKAKAKLETLEVFEEIADAIEGPNGISIKEGMAATELSYHRFYAIALLLNVMGKVRFVRIDGETQIIAATASCAKGERLFTSSANTAPELHGFLADVVTGLCDGSVSPSDAQMIALAVGDRLNESVLAEAS